MFWMKVTDHFKPICKCVHNHMISSWTKSIFLKNREKVCVATILLFSVKRGKFGVRNSYDKQCHKLNVACSIKNYTNLCVTEENVHTNVVVTEGCLL